MGPPEPGRPRRSEPTSLTEELLQPVQATRPSVIVRIPQLDARHLLMRHHDLGVIAVGVELYCDHSLAHGIAFLLPVPGVDQPSRRINGVYFFGGG